MQAPESENQSERKIFWWNVVASVVASIIVIALIQPLLTLFWDFLSSTGSALLNRFVDKLYKGAALGNRNWVIAILAIALLYVPFTNALVVAAVRPLIKKKLQNKAGDSKTRSKTVLLATLVAVSIIGIVLATIPAAFIYTDLQLNSSFNQRLQVLAPHLTDQQVKVLKASWASMTSKSDYLKIKNEMNRLADEAKIALPRPLLQD